MISVDWQRLIRLEQGAQIAFVHQIGANEASKSEWAGHCLLGCLRQAQQQKGNQRDSDLNANGVLRGAEKTADFEGLLDPAEEQFDGPPPPVQIGDDPGRSRQVIGHDAQDLAAVDDDLEFADLLVEWVLAAIGLSRRSSSLPKALTENGQVGSRNTSKMRGPWPQTRGSARHAFMRSFLYPVQFAARAPSEVMRRAPEPSQAMTKCRVCV